MPTEKHQQLVRELFVASFAALVSKHGVRQAQSDAGSLMAAVIAAAKVFDANINNAG